MKSSLDKNYISGQAIALLSFFWNPVPICYNMHIIRLIGTHGAILPLKLQRKRAFPYYCPLAIPPAIGVM